MALALKRKVKPPRVARIRPTVAALLADVRTRRAADEPVDVSVAGDRHWLLVLETLIADGDVAVATTLAPALRAAFPKVERFEVLATLLAHAPAVAAALTRFPRRALHLIPHPGADTVLFSFGTAIPPLLLQHWLAPLGVHVVHVAPFPDLVRFEGKAPTREDLPGLAAMRAIVTDLGDPRVVCLGSSRHGFYAMLYGLRMNAAAVLGLNALTRFPTAFRKPRHLSIARRLLGRDPSAEELDGLDLLPEYQAAPSPPRVHLVHASRHPKDRLLAERMIKVNGCSTESVTGVRMHSIQHLLAESGRLPILFDWLITRGTSPVPQVAVQTRKPKQKHATDA